MFLSKNSCFFLLDSFNASSMSGIKALKLSPILKNSSGINVSFFIIKNP